MLAWTGAALGLMGGRNETGGRCDTETRLSSAVVGVAVVVPVCCWSVLGSSNSRWPCAHTFVEVSTAAACCAATAAAAAACAAWAASTACSRCVLSAGGGNVDVATPFVLCEAGARRVCFAGVVTVEAAADSRIVATVDGESGNDAGRRAAVNNLAVDDGVDEV